MSRGAALRDLRAGRLARATERIRALEADVERLKGERQSWKGLSRDIETRAERAEARLAEAKLMLKAVVRHKRPGDGQLVQIPVVVWIQVRDFLSRSLPECESGGQAGAGEISDRPSAAAKSGGVDPDRGGES